MQLLMTLSPPPLPRQKVPADRISFVDAWRWLQQAQPGEALPDLIVNPQRPGRYEPRQELRKLPPIKRSKT